MRVFWQYLFLFNAIKFLCAVDKIMTKQNSSLLLKSKKQISKKPISRSNNTSLQCNHHCDKSCNAPLDEPKKPADAKLGVTIDMIVEAITRLNKGESGSSWKAIVNWMLENYALEKDACQKGVMIGADIVR